MALVRLLQIIMLKWQKTWKYFQWSSVITLHCSLLLSVACKRTMWFVHLLSHDVPNVGNEWKGVGPEYGQGLSPVLLFLLLKMFLVLMIMCHSKRRWSLACAHLWSWYAKGCIILATLIGAMFLLHLQMTLNIPRVGWMSVVGVMAASHC
jgi:hypothetical protein